MKKILPFILAGVIGMIGAQAQVLFKKGSVDAAAGVGLIPNYIADNVQVNTLPVNFRVGYRVSNQMSLSAFAAYSAYEKSNVVRPDESIDHISSRELTVGIRSAVHALRAERFDVYGGLMLGYQMPNTEITQAAKPKGGNTGGVQPSFSRPAQNHLLYSGFIGASYLPSRNMGIFGEIGYGISLFNVGLQWKLR